MRSGKHSSPRYILSMLSEARLAAYRKAAARERVSLAEWIRSVCDAAYTEEFRRPFEIKRSR